MSEIHTQPGRTKLASLSNRWPCRVVVQTREYASGEHAFHGEKYFRLAQLCPDPLRAKLLFEQAALFIGDALSMDDAHTAGKRFRLTPEERALWSEMSNDVQTDICRWKAAHSREVQEELFLSGTKTLVHLNKRRSARASSIWDGKVRVCPVSGDIRVVGGNMLGYIWMDVRSDRVALLEWGAETYCD